LTITVSAGKPPMIDLRATGSLAQWGRRRRARLALDGNDGDNKGAS